MIEFNFSKIVPMNRAALVTFFVCTFLSVTSYAAQTGSIIGVVSKGGNALENVSVEASSNVLPRPRSVNTAANGRYKFSLLPPGQYRLVFKGPDGSQTVRTVAVQLDQAANINVAMSDASAMEEVIAYGSTSAADLATASLKSSMSSELIDGLPVGQQYRDVIKLIPGVQYSEDTTRGPSAGGNGQDNSYQFDGVDVSTPLFGTLGAEPSTHDIDQVSVVKGGASAVGFNRSGGFTINTVSKAGTNEFKGEVSYQFQNANLTADQKDSTQKEFDEDKAWIVANIGGPIIKDRLFFYASYYGPTIEQDNSDTAYGPVGNFDSDRDEYFGKLTLSPTDDMLLSLSHRSSDRTNKNAGVGDFETASLSEGETSSLAITIAEGSWLITDDTNVSFKYTDYENENFSGPDNKFSFAPQLGSSLNVAALDTQGRLTVPRPITGETAYNAFIQPLIDTFGYIENGVATGGGGVGGASTVNDQDFFRESYEISVDHTLYMGDTTHDLHFGYKHSESSETLSRLSNGWGSITVPGGRSTTADGTPIFYEARIQQMSLGGTGGILIPEIESGFETQSIEINDTITWNDFTFNIGILFSNDELYGQGLKKASGTVSGFEVALGSTYLMHEDDFSDMIQPRLGVTYDWTAATSVFANYALYNPAASSLPRAASWARNLRRSIRVRFDQNGDFIDIDPVRSSSGKVFQDGIEPRQIEEFLVGMTHEFDNGISGRMHIRHRKGDNFWEDTNNNARSRFEPPPGIPTEDYIPNLADIRAEIGGSSYVIAELDGAFTKYWEVSFEGEWSHDNWFVRGSYVWSHYYGNFDQDNTTTTNDANSFVGSSFIADGAGRQLWNNRRGDLRGDRRHQFKVYGFYQLPWRASVGAYLIAQSGQPWEAWDVEVYRNLTGSSSDTSRYAESAGSRTSDSHWQLDLNYTHNFAVMNDYNLQLRADMYNVFDNQTGYNIQPKRNSAGFGDPRDSFNPRRLQLAIKLQF